MIRYIDISQLACDLTFAWFLVSWLVTRHFLFLFVIFSTVFQLPKHVPFILNPERGYYLTKSAYVAFCIMLGALQVRAFSQVLSCRTLDKFEHRFCNVSGSG